MGFDLFLVVQVYKGQFVNVTAYDDLLAVTQRALSAIMVDQSVSSEQIAAFAQFVVMTATWETAQAVSFCDATIRAIFSSSPSSPKNHKAKPSKIAKSLSNAHVKVFIGYNAQNTIRLRFPVRLVVDATPAAIKTSSDSSDFIYYREHLLEFLSSVNAMSLFGASYSSTSAAGLRFRPPEPPRKGSATALR
jgi:hypothetical protein